MTGFSINGDTLGQRIRSIRKNRNMSQSELGSLVGVTDRWISQLEKDKAVPSPELMHKIARTFQIPVRELLQENESTMENSVRIKLVEVLLESEQPLEAQDILSELLNHAQLSQTEQYTLKILQAEYYYQMNQLDDAIALLEPFSDSLESENYYDAEILAYSRNMIGKSYYQKRDFTNALYNYRKAYDYTKRFESMNILAAKIIYNLGVTLRMKGFNRESIPYLEEAHRFFVKNNDLRTLAYTLFEKGIAHKNAKELEKASLCFEESKAILMALNLKSLYVILQHTLATEVTMFHDPDLAFVQLQECLDEVKLDDNKQRLVLIFSKFARVHLFSNCYQKAFEALDTASVIVKEHSLDSTVEAAEMNKVYAQYFSISKNFSKVIECALNAAATFGRMGLRNDQIEALQLVACAYEAMENYKDALHFERECKKIALDLRRE